MNANDFLYIVELNSARDVEVEDGITEPSWEEFRDSLLHHEIRRLKDGPAFIPVMMKPESEWQLLKPKKGGPEHYRGDINIEAITALVIDIDKPGALETSEQIFEGYEYAVYSTHNFTPETPWKYRMVIRLAEPILIEDWPACFDAMKSRIDLDPSCRNPSRCYYYPSHSVDAHISPRAFYRMGRAITKDEIIALASSDLKSANSPFRMRTLGTMPIQNVRAKRHFSGKIVGHYDALPQVLSFERKDYEARHAKSINDYMKDDSRHNLALSITSREYYMLGPRADVRSMLLFLYQVAAEGGRPLESGNTTDELPDMLVSAMRKYAPEAYTKMLEDYGERSMNWLIDEIDWAQRNYMHVHQRTLSTQSPQRQEDATYAVYRNRHKEYLKDYVNDGDAEKLFTRASIQSLRIDAPAYADLAKAMIRYCKGYFTTVLKEKPERVLAEVGRQVNAFCELLKSPQGVIAEIEPEKRKFMRSAMLVELTKERKKHANNNPSPEP